MWDYYLNYLDDVVAWEIVVAVAVVHHWHQQLMLYPIRSFAIVVVWWVIGVICSHRNMWMCRMCSVQPMEDGVV